MKLAIDRLLAEPELQKDLADKRLAVMGHPASMTSQMQHTLDALGSNNQFDLVAAFGPQHGMRGDKQDNMIESGDYLDPRHRIPVFSLYGEVRRPTDEMMHPFDLMLFDLQDIGCRIYTYVTTLLYIMEACARHKKELWVLDRPNPAGRTVEGSLLQEGWTSFVGAGKLLMRHGLTIGELALWFKKNHKLEVELKVIPMAGYNPGLVPGFGWPQGELSWVNPSPNASNLNMARIFSCSVLIEGTKLSEGRGTTTPLEIMGAPDLAVERILKAMQNLAPEWMEGAVIRPCFFEPTFHKHQGKLCQGFQIHTDNPLYQPGRFRPYRLTALFLKAIRQEYPDYDLWQGPPYEYENERMPVDLLSGGTTLREWVDDAGAVPADLDSFLKADEAEWQERVPDYLLYS